MRRSSTAISFSSASSRSLTASAVTSTFSPARGFNSSETSSFSSSGFSGATSSMLFGDLNDHACAYGLAALADGKALLFFQSNGRDKLDVQFNSIARHDHFHASRQGYFARYVRRADVELRLVALEERRVAATLL